MSSMTATTGYAEAADALRRLALSERANAYVLDHPPLYQALLRAARRFIGGETLEECLETARAINDRSYALDGRTWIGSARYARMASRMIAVFDS